MKRLLLGLASVVVAAVVAGAMELPEDFRSGWKFNNGPEFPGAGGNLETTQHSAELHADFSGGGDYVELTKNFGGNGVLALRLETAGEAAWVGILAVDANGESHFFRLTAPSSTKPDEWRPLALDFRSGSSGEVHWGGDNDGALQLPVRQLSLRIQKSSTKHPASVTKFRNMKLDRETVDWRVTSPDALYFEPAEGNQLSIQLPKGITLTEEECYGRIFNYQRQEVNVTSATYDPATGLLTIDVPSLEGFYELEYPQLHLTPIGFTVFPPAPAKPDRFFGIDGAFSFFDAVAADRRQLQAYFNVLALNGITSCRDRLSWTTLEPEPEKFDWSHGRRNKEATMEIARAAGIDILELWHNAPDWSGARNGISRRDFYPYPRDFTKLGRSWREIFRKWGHAYQAFEVWNEPELSTLGRNLPGDRLTALHKAISYFARQEAPDLPLVGGVFGGELPERFFEPYLANGLVEESDVLSFHTYDRPENMVSLVSAWRKALADTIKPSMPIYVTESGMPWHNGTLPRAGFEDDRKSAMMIAAKAAELKACGIERHYAFVMPYYREGGNNFSMIDANHTPMRSFAAYAMMARMLAGKTYIGDLEKGNNTRSARVFSDGHDAVAVIYSDNCAAYRLPAGIEFKAAYGIDGRTLPLGETIPNPDGILYLTTQESQLAHRVDTNTDAMRLLKVTRFKSSSARPAKPVVFQPDLDVRKFRYTRDKGYQLPDPSHAELPVWVNNLSDQEITVAPTVELPSGGVLLEPLAEELRLAPNSREQLLLKVDLSKVFTEHESVGVKISDKNDHATAAVLPLAVYKVKRVIAKPARTQSEWTPLTEWRNWSNQAPRPEIQGKFRFTWRDNLLILEVEVIDERPVIAPAAVSLWQFDSIQLGIQRLDADGMPGPAREFLEIGAGQTEKGPLFHCYSFLVKPEKPNSKPAVTAEVSRHDTLTSYRVSIGATELGGTLKAGDLLGFSLLINDNSGSGRRGYLYFGDGIGYSKSAQEFQQLELVDQKK